MVFTVGATRMVFQRYHQRHHQDSILGGSRQKLHFAQQAQILPVTQIQIAPREKHAGRPTGMWILEPLKVPVAPSLILILLTEPVRYVIRQHRFGKMTEAATITIPAITV
jgi:hypothetical protein